MPVSMLLSAKSAKMQLDRDGDRDRGVCMHANCVYVYLRSVYVYMRCLLYGVRCVCVCVWRMKCVVCVCAHTC